MTAAELIEYPGITITVIAGDLEIESQDNISNDLIAQFKHHKAEIVRLLSDNTPSSKIAPVEKDLMPCPLCDGRDFVHGKRDGYFCRACQPGITGVPVQAGGNRNKPIPPKWGAKKSVTFPKARGRRISTNTVTWLQEHKTELHSASWTAVELWKRSSPSGIAFLSVWERPGVEAIIRPDGSIAFRYTSTTGQTIVQTAHPGGV